MQIFDKNLNFNTKFGSQGKNDGQFNYVCGVVVDPATRNIIISDWANHRICIFNNGGYFISKFGSEGKSDGQFKNPCGLAIDPMTRNIWVCDAGFFFFFFDLRFSCLKINKNFCRQQPYSSI